MFVTLRAAVPEDAPRVRDIYAYYIEHSEATFNEVLKPMEAYRESIQTLLETYPFLVAEDEAGRFLGFANAEPLRPQTGYRYTVELTIYLDPHTPQHAGVGTRLYGALLPCLKAQGFYSAYGIINSANEASYALHRHFGFRQAGLLENCAYKHGKWLSALYLCKTLAPVANPPKAIVPFSEYRKTNLVG